MTETVCAGPLRELIERWRSNSDHLKQGDPPFTGLGDLAIQLEGCADELESALAAPAPPQGDMSKLIEAVREHAVAREWPAEGEVSTDDEEFFCIFCEAYCLTAESLEHKPDCVTRIQSPAAPPQGERDAHISAWQWGISQAAQCAEEQNTIGPNNIPRRSESVRDSIAKAIRSLECPFPPAAPAPEKPAIPEQREMGPEARANLKSYYEKHRAARPVAPEKPYSEPLREELCKLFIFGKQDCEIIADVENIIQRERNAAYASGHAAGKGEK